MHVLSFVRDGMVSVKCSNSSHNTLPRTPAHRPCDLLPLRFTYFTTQGFQTRRKGNSTLSHVVRHITYKVNKTACAIINLRIFIFTPLLVILNSGYQSISMENKKNITSLLHSKKPC